MAPLYGQSPARDSGGKPQWCIEPNRIIPEHVTGTSSSEGTIRSVNCTEATHFEDHICAECRDVPNIGSLRARLRRSALAQSTSIDSQVSSHKNNRYRGLEATGKKLNEYRQLTVNHRLQTLNLSKKLARAKGAKQKLTDKITEEGQRGDVSAITRTLHEAYERGLLRGKTNILTFIKTIVSNMRKKPKGKRYDKFTKTMFQVIKIWGGWRMAKFFAMNMGGPSEGTIKRITRQYNTPAEQGFQASTISRTLETYKHLMETNQIESVLVEQAEDETVIVKLLQYIQATDTVVGSCGITSLNHRCVSDHFLVIGSEETAYEDLKQFFANSVIASMARVIMLNPLHPNLPATVVFLAPTCNKFTTLDVIDQWKIVQNIYNRHFLPLFKTPLTGKASDGDSRRRRAQLLSAKSKEGVRYHIDHPNFTLTGRVTDNHGNETTVCSLDIMNQDYIHCGKKLVNPLDHPTRKLMIGGHLVHINHLNLVMTRFEAQQHGLRTEDVTRQDRQNWGSAQRICFPRVQECLKKLECGEEGMTQEDVKGTRIYLFICFLFIEIFCSLTASLTQRITYASQVANFLRIWRWWVYQHPVLSLKENFITKQCFEDVLITCHASVLLIKAARDFAPNEEIHLAKCGTDCVEDFFSQNGSWTMNRHNYTYGDMLMALPSMNRITEVRADPKGPTIPKGHKKQLNIWDQGTKAPDTPPNMKDYPSDADIKAAWEKGISEAQRVCTEVGKYTVFTVFECIEINWKFGII